MNITNTRIPNTPSTNEGKHMKRKHSKITIFLAGFTFLGLLWIALLSDTFSQAAQVEPKDYAAEEALNLERVSQSRENVSYGKLTDEKAVQYVNDAITDIYEDDLATEEEEEVVVLPEEPQEDPEGEEF